MSNDARLLMEIYAALLDYFGPRGWWPGETRLEVMMGAILTQAVSWKNVTRAIDNLKATGILDLEKLVQVPEEVLAETIRPALYHRQKAKKTKALVQFLMERYGGDLDKMFACPLPGLRQELLAIWGIGPETADSILLYAGNKPIFVIDAYTGRIFSRLGLVSENISYHDLQQFIQERVPLDAEVYNEYHALLVGLGAHLCKKQKPGCANCPLGKWCNYFLNLQENT